MKSGVVMEIHDSGGEHQMTVHSMTSDKSLDSVGSTRSMTLEKVLDSVECQFPWESMTL